MVSSLFTDFDVEVRTEAFDLTTPDLPPFYMHVFSLSRIRRLCAAQGYEEFVSQDFDMDIDLPPPESNGLGTYTRTLDGRRLQFSGPVFLPWKFIAVRRRS